MEYRRRPYQQQQGLWSELGNDPVWLLFGMIVALALALAGLPWIITGFAAQRYLQRWLHWRLSALLWFILLFVGAFALYHNYQHGLKPLFDQEITDYTHAIIHYQWDILSYPFRQLWPETWQVWLHTWQGIGIAGLVAEMAANRNDTVRNLRDQERQRQRRAERFQRRARRRTSRPTHIPDEVGGTMVVGVPIRDDEEN